jgi:hypothetical protein
MGSISRVLLNIYGSVAAVLGRLYRAARRTSLLISYFLELTKAWSSLRSGIVAQEVQEYLGQGYLTFFKIILIFS